MATKVFNSVTDQSPSDSKPIQPNPTDSNHSQTTTMPRVMGIDFAPWTLPLKRRLQTATIVWFTADFLVTGLFALSLLTYLLWTRWFWVTCLYIVWWVADKQSCNQGGRRRCWIRWSPMYKLFRDYFPISLIKTSELDPSRNYIFGVHPHGVLCFGTFCNFATEATGFSKLFPGLRPRLLTLEENFYLPFHREMTLWHGVCAATKHGMEWLLNNEGQGNALVLVVGGARESLDAVPGKMALTLENRKGFVKIALKNGADLVPVINFGENEVYYMEDRPESNSVRQFQKKFLNAAGFAPPLFYGRGIFQYTFGLLPFRKPIVSVVGKAIEVVKTPNPTQDQILELHKKYTDAVVALYNDHKDKYGFANVPISIN